MDQSQLICLYFESNVINFWLLWVTFTYLMLHSVDELVKAIIIGGKGLTISPSKTNLRPLIAKPLLHLVGVD